MIKNYLLVAIRNIIKYRFFSFINIIGLSISMSAGLLIILLFADQKKYDQFHENFDNIYRITSNFNDHWVSHATSPMPLKDALNEYTGIGNVVRLRSNFGGDISFNQTTRSSRGFYADSDFFNLFSFELLKGDPNTALLEPYSLVITEELALTLFSDSDPLGKSVQFNDRGLSSLGVEIISHDEVSLHEFTVTGVVKSEDKTHIKFDVLGSMSTLETTYNGSSGSSLKDWRNFYISYLYFMPEKGTSEEKLNQMLQEISEDKYSTFENFQVGFDLQPLKSITPGKFLNNPMSFRLPQEAILLLSLLAFLIVISACFNYANLSFARVLSRTKEIGIRKMIGAKRKQIFTQLIGEAVVVSLLSLLLAIGILQILKYGFSNLWINNYLEISMSENIIVFIVFVLFSVWVGVQAGLIPAWILSSINPHSILKSQLSIKNSKKTFLFSKPRMGKFLVGIQFVFSIVLIITTALIYDQMQHFMRVDYGFEKGNIVNIHLQDNEYASYLKEIKNYTDVHQVAACSMIPGAGNRSNKTYVHGNSGNSQSMYSMSADHNYVNVLNLTLLAGSNFSPEGYHSNQLIVNEEGARNFGFDNPEAIIGEIVEVKGSAHLFEVIGVVKNYYFDILANKP